MGPFCMMCVFVYKLVFDTVRNNSQPSESFADSISRYLQLLASNVVDPLQLALACGSFTSQALICLSSATGG